MQKIVALFKLFLLIKFILWGVVMLPEETGMEAFYQIAAEHVAVGLHAIDLMGRTVLYNQKMKEIEGFDLEQIQDRSILELFRFEGQESTLLKVLHGGDAVLNVKQTYWNRKGQEITTINNTYPVFDNEKLIGAIEIARDVTRLERIIFQPLKKDAEPITFSSFVAASDSMKRVLETAEKAAASKLPVLLVGESGTGKERVAEAIHRAGSSEKPMHTLFCHGTDESLIEQLSRDLQETSDGTIYHERIDLLPPELQQSLLNVLTHQADEKGSHFFIASVGEDPVELIASGKLLKELYYFFSSLTIQIEPLRKRKEDILPFTEDFFSRHRLKFGSFISTLDEQVKTAFLQYDWPGNEKQLELVLEEMTALVTTEEIAGPDLLPPYFKMKVQQSDVRQPEDFLIQPEKEMVPLDEYLLEAERYYLEKAMALHDHNITKAAQALGMSRQNLQYRLRKIKKTIKMDD